MIDLRHLIMWSQKIILHTKTLYIVLFILLLGSNPFKFTAQAKQDSINNLQTIQPTIVPPSPDYTNPSQFINQYHAYSLKFNSNGEALVSAKIVFTNHRDTPLTNFKLQIPSVTLTDIIVLQVVHNPRCISSKQNPLSSNNSITLDIGIDTSQVCEKFQEDNYYNLGASSATRTKYLPTSSLQDNDTLTIQLPKPIGKNSNGSILLFFKSKSYTKKNIYGSYRYFFQTFKVGDPISSLLLSVSVENNLLLTNALEIPPGPEPPLPEIKKISNGDNIDTTPVNKYYNSIGTGFLTSFSPLRPLILKPFETYSIHGSYASSFIKLYAKEVLFSTIFIAFLVKLLLRFLRKRTILIRYSLIISLFSVSISPYNSYGYKVMQLLLYNHPFRINLQLILYANIFLLLIIPLIYATLKGAKFGISLFLLSVVFSIFGNILFIILALVFNVVHCFFPGVNCMF